MQPLERRAQIRARLAALIASQAKPLQVAAGTPSLYVTRTTYDLHENLVEFDQEFWRDDVLEMAVQVHTGVVVTAPMVAALSP